MKKKILICGIKMNMGGTEKALLSFLETIDREKYNIDLVLAESGGALAGQLPSDIQILKPIKNGSLFSLSKRNVFKTIRQLDFPHKKKFLFNHIHFFITAPFSCYMYQKLWILLMKQAILPFDREFEINTEYDICLAFWGDRTMFYMSEKVNAKQKIAWLHFDYFHPKRDDRIYRYYFDRCTAVISVSRSCTKLLKEHFPELESKFFTLLNSLPEKEILCSSEKNTEFPDQKYTGLRLLSVMRICRQKGYFLIPNVLYLLKQENIKARWYIAGTGSKKDTMKLCRKAKRLGVSDMLILLGHVDNPYPYIKKCDIFILPSKYEGMPITVEEAKLLRKPIVCTNYLSATEQLDNGRYGEICSYSAKSIFLAVKKIISHTL